ncbi:chemotaxis protein CheA [Evansella halocellulosilytica]|uniref:chemotaxis protein CheA n=1 Tax=Evansella halocellulosilytica TaxID=2011013 RepID=UPI000BB72933|nr:chemotaxis protein CheA [Evansella halocellulosilytica]
METSQYLDMFIEESQEHLQAINEHLLSFEKDHENLTLVDEIFRSAHTLKGMSATMGFEDLASLTHQMENVLDAVRNKKISVTEDIIDIVFDAVDHLEKMVTSITEGGDGKLDVSHVVAQLEKVEKGTTIDQNNSEQTMDKMSTVVPAHTFDEYQKTVISQAVDQGYGVYEIAIQLDDQCMLKGARAYMVFEVLENKGEIIQSVPSVEEIEQEQFENTFSITFITEQNEKSVKDSIYRVSEIKDVMIQRVSLEESASSHSENDTKPDKADLKKETNNKKTEKRIQTKSIRVNLERIDKLMNSFEELLVDKARLEQRAREKNDQPMVEIIEQMNRASTDLQNTILDMRMVPIDEVFNRFPKMVRSLTKELGKKIELEVTGAETELDRTMVDQIGDPLVHLIRNSVDHGIEDPVVRKQAGKKETGHIHLKSFHSGNDVIIEIVDDGAGIDKEKIIKKAVNKGIITSENRKALTDPQVFDLLFAPGFSTAEQISDISGRGVGLDVVKNTIESLGGSIVIESKLGEGTSFSIQLPLTLSIITALLVDVQNETYALPLTSIKETAVITKDQINHVHSQTVLQYRDKVIPLVFLSETFGLNKIDADEYSTVIVHKGEKQVALVVDGFIGQREIVIKGLGNYLNQVFAISGSTILGDGEVALIVDCNALIS